MKATTHHTEVGGRPRPGCSDDEHPSKDAAATAVHPSEVVAGVLPRASPMMLAAARPLLDGLSICFLRETASMCTRLKGVPAPQ